MTIQFIQLTIYFLIGTYNFSNLTLTQAKRLEMDSQVRVLELENDLEKERRRLGELRKKHYQLAGETIDENEVKSNIYFRNNSRTKISIQTSQ